MTYPVECVERIDQFESSVHGVRRNSIDNSQCESELGRQCFSRDGVVYHYAKCRLDSD